MKTPLKSKSRLSKVLGPHERLILTLTMLEDVLKALKSSMVYRICVISSDTRVKALSNKYGVVHLSESRHGLNRAIEQATEWCIQNNAKSVLVLPADIPLITREDINQVVELGSQEISVVISPSGSGGTNALFRKPPNLIPASFGRHSFIKHVKEASNKVMSTKFYCSRRVILDIDSIDDLRNFLKIEGKTMTRIFLEQIGLRKRLANL